MGLSINTNISSMMAVKDMGSTTAKLGKTFERLASGLRVNAPADDSSAFAISERMTSQIKGMNAALRNTSDGISALQIADSALSETASSLQRMRELVIQAGNSSITTEDRAVINSNLTALIEEITRISSATQYNNQNIIDGTFSAKVFQIGANAGQTLSLTITATSAGDLGVSAVSAASAASEGLGNIDAALTSVATIRANLGTMQNRFDTVIAGLNNVGATTTAARSRLIDADIAKETADLTRLSIMQQAGASVLSQANQQPSVMLQLLRG